MGGPWSGMFESVIAYGERPITEFLILLSGKEDIDALLKRIQFLDGSPEKPLSADELVNIIIEAPLGRKRKGKGKSNIKETEKEGGTVDIAILMKSAILFIEVKPEQFDRVVKSDNKYKEQIKRYFNFLKKPPHNKDKQNLSVVQCIINITKEAENRYLILMTDDQNMPDRQIRELIGPDEVVKVGWLPYSAFNELAGRHGYQINGEPSHIWIKKM